MGIGLLHVKLRTHHNWRPIVTKFGTLMKNMSRGAVWLCHKFTDQLHIWHSHLVRQSNVIIRPNPALTVKVFFSLDYTSLGCLERISSGYQEYILEQFEKSKMAAKMAAIAKKKLNHLILLIKSRVISLFPLNVIRGIHFWCYFCNLRSITRSNIIFKVIYSTVRQY